MSLLLEALKKAALEKQSRIEPPPIATPISAPIPASQPAADTADEAIREVINQSAETVKPDVSTPVDAASEDSHGFNDTLDQEDEVQPIEEDQTLAADWDEMEELDLDGHEVENFNFEPASSEPEVESPILALEETEHGVKEARLKQEALQQKQKDERNQRDEKARELAEIDRQKAGTDSKQKENRNRQSLDQLIASGKAVERRSKRRSAFLYAMLVMTALGGILSYYFYLTANSGIAGLQQPQLTESDIDIAEIIEATELEALAAAQISGTAEQAIDTTENAALKGRIDKNGQTDNALTTATLSEPSAIAEVAFQNAPDNNAMQRNDSPPSTTDYLNPLILTSDRGSQASGVAKRIIIHHPQSSLGLTEVLQSAYSALQQRQLPKAAMLYDQALAVDSNQRDALLGAAATATALGKFDDAATYYQRRLNADPKDSFARAGLLALMNDGKSRAAVQREVATLLARNPESSHLHFLKGVGFASEGRWNQAQSAFYEAYSLDNNNPDYAFNLAVSLDHLRQPPLARVYYERALNLAKTRTANFDITAIEQRLLELSQP
jgi:tetratricopeptide (TPR) repeat protein